MADINRGLTMLLNAKAKSQRVPLSGAFELTPCCNLNCKMCYVRKSAAEVNAHGRQALSLEGWKALADEALKNGTLFLLLTGGEPFLWPHFRELYQYLSGKGFVLSINSNATLITPELAAWLAEFPPCRVNVSLYGASDETYRRLCGVSGMFTRAVQGIDALLSSGIQVKINASMTPDNIADLPQIIEFAHQRNLLVQHSSYMYPPVRRDLSAASNAYRFTPEEAARCTLEFHRLSDTPEAFASWVRLAASSLTAPAGLDIGCNDPMDGTLHCQAGTASYWITWDGLMTPCAMMSQPCEDVATLGFLPAWQRIVAHTESMRLSGICEACPDRKACHHCAAAALAETGDVGGVPKYLCEMADALRTLAGQLLEP